MSNPLPANAAVWFEIPVTDMQRSMAFYGNVLGAELTLDETGPNPMADFRLRRQKCRRRPPLPRQAVRRGVRPDHPSRRHRTA